MSLKDATKIVAWMLVAGGPESQLARVRWPLHLALRELWESAGRRGTRQLLGVELDQHPSANVGMETRYADEALAELVRRGILRRHGFGRRASLLLDIHAAPEIRRELMTLDADRVALLQRAGARWAALSCTALKNRSIAPISSGSTVSSSTPNREKLDLSEGA
jgi:hypothetical protein